MPWHWPQLPPDPCPSMAPRDTGPTAGCAEPAQPSPRQTDQPGEPALLPAAGIRGLGALAAASPVPSCSRLSICCLDSAGGEMQTLSRL